MCGLRRDQVEFHDENKCLLHNNLSESGNITCGASDVINLKFTTKILTMCPKLANITCGAGLSRDQIEIHDENKYLLHNNVVRWEY
jgi:hypothetical protein